MEISLDGWDIQSADAAEWVPWGTRGDAKAKILGAADGHVRQMVAGDGYAAATGSTHADFATETGATYIIIFRL